MSSDTMEKLTDEFGGLNASDLQHLILDNKYIKECYSNKKKDKSSLSSLIDIPLSQSESIKLGIGIEDILRELISKYSNLKNIKPKNKKGNKERDHLFCDEKNKKIYYAELKANINLDTEKSKITSLKCLQIVEELNEQYSDYEINWCLVAYRYINFTDIPTTIKNKYNNISKNLYGINQYLSMLGINLVFDEKTYKSFLNDIAHAMFNNS